MREKQRDGERLQHILSAISDILEFTENKSFEDFQASKMMRHAVYRNLTIIGEAANLLTHDFRAEHHDIAWHSIIGMRHVLVHDYYETEDAVIWQTIANDLPLLKLQVEQLFAIS